MKKKVEKVEYNDSGLLIYEGNYLNGKSNGKGKEYYDDSYILILKFEGEYLNGLKWSGKGLKKNKNFMHEIKEGKGIIKEYYDNGNKEYEGEYFNGEKIGKEKNILMLVNYHLKVNI